MINSYIGWIGGIMKWIWEGIQSVLILFRLTIAVTGIISFSLLVAMACLAPWIGLIWFIYWIVGGEA